jgi:hypothetical protein
MAGDGEECVVVFVFVFVWGRGGYLDVGEEVTGSWSKLHKRDFDILKVYTPFIIVCETNCTVNRLLCIRLMYSDSHICHNFTEY